MGISQNVSALVDAEMQKYGISLNTLSKKIGLNQPTLFRICDGTTKSPKVENLEKIARYFGTTIELLRRASVKEITDLQPSSNGHGVERKPESSGVESEPEVSIEVVTAAVSALLSKFGLSVDEYVLAKRASDRSTRRTTSPSFKRVSDRGAHHSNKTKKQING